MAGTDIYYRKWVEFNLEDSTTQAQIAAKINEMAFVLKQNSITPAVTGYPSGTVVANAVTANGNSTVYDFGVNDGEDVREATLVRIVTTITTTPTVTIAIQGSRDGTNYSNLKYADSAAPFTFGSSNLVVTTASTAVKIIKAGQQYRYLRVTFSATLNVTSTIDFYPLGD
ncbi:MAG: hypothetical protein ACREHG_07000 [Candidatus Saccharimonadales bacterium]